MVGFADDRTVDFHSRGFIRKFHLPQQILHRRAGFYLFFVTIDDDVHTFSLAVAVRIFRFDLNAFGFDAHACALQMEDAWGVFRFTHGLGQLFEGASG